MQQPTARTSLLVKFYHRYLSDGDTAQLIVSIARHFSVATLERLLLSGHVQTRRAAALAIGLLGDQSSVALLGPLLRANDRRLRLVVDDALRAIAAREGSVEERLQLEQIIRCNECGHFERTIELTQEVIDQGVALKYITSGSLARYQLDHIQLAIEDCRQVLGLNRYHYAAMVGLGHCHLELGDLVAALHWFRQALEVYPDLEPIRVQVTRLEKAIQEL